MSLIEITKYFKFYYKKWIEVYGFYKNMKNNSKIILQNYFKIIKKKLKFWISNLLHADFSMHVCATLIFTVKKLHLFNNYKLFTYLNI